jgi:hypothetical protein
MRQAVNVAVATTLFTDQFATEHEELTIGDAGGAHQCHGVLDRERRHRSCPSHQPDFINGGGDAQP